jgi:hypothetical protein
VQFGHEATVLPFDHVAVSEQPEAFFKAELFNITDFRAT